MNSVIAVFPLKTGDLMFVGFDSQNTSTDFPHYPNWNLWVGGISLIGFRGDSENAVHAGSLPEIRRTANGNQRRKPTIALPSASPIKK